MPYVNPPVCYLCGKIHSCDTKDIFQMVAPDGDTVNVCNNHPGVREEHHRQNNLTGEEARKLALKSLAHPRTQKMMTELREEMRQRSMDYLERMTLMGKRDEALQILYGS
jgi:hypothetical protein